MPQKDERKPRPKSAVEKFVEKKEKARTFVAKGKGGEYRVSLPAGKAEREARKAIEKGRAMHERSEKLKFRKESFMRDVENRALREAGAHPERMEQLRREARLEFRLKRMKGRE